MTVFVSSLSASGLPVQAGQVWSVVVQKPIFGRELATDWARARAPLDELDWLKGKLSAVDVDAVGIEKWERLG
ncbi:hypothetical protein VPNG_07508 [Cytospora leucostoma]|uniref:Uncharacterized protein n=1 Tax=Cytospora leucostoma TaxID=1230097 RepID=A0A423WSG3_9PEZI|nr:hypothetical protein VPNG_07508 [Cytospora leucostoma]